MSVVGIDPGLDGYACRLLGSCATFYAAPTLETGRKNRRAHDLAGLVALCLEWRESGVLLVVIEKQQSFGARARGRTQGVASSFLTGFGYGAWLASLVATGLTYEEVPPQRWKTSLACMNPPGLGGDRAEALRRIVERAGALFPDVDLRALERAKNPGRVTAKSADKSAALLLAEYARRQR